MAVRRMNFGSGSIGPILAPGWVAVDKQDFGQTEGCIDIREGLPYLSDSFDYIVANHSLQQLTIHELVPALTELRRVLKVGGVLRAICPDVLKWVMHGDPPFLDKLVGDEVAVSREGKLCVWATWYGTNITPLSAEFLAELCIRAGFTRAAEMTPMMTWADLAIGDLEQDGRADESFVVEALK